MAILQSRARNKLGVSGTISRFGAVTSLVGNGVDNLTVSGGDTGDFIHTVPFQFNKVQTSYGRGFSRTTEVFQRRIYEITSFGVLDSGAASVLPEADAQSFQDEAIEIAKAKLYAKLTADLNLAVDLLEGGKTIQMLRSTLKFKSLLSEFFTQIVIPKRVLKRGRLRGITPSQARLDYITAKWLEYRYGWFPIYKSIYQAMEELQKSFRTDNALTIFKRGNVEKEKTLITGLGTINSPKVKTNTWGSARAQYIMNFYLPPEATLSDWTSLNPIGIAYELLPLSFVGDWFFNVGKYLEQLETYLRYKTAFRFGQLTVGTFTLSNTNTYGITDSGYTYFLNGELAGGTGITSVNKDATYYVSTFNRVITGFPVPTPPRIKADLNSFRILDAAALIQQIAVRGLR